jgi:hypothetical protein
MVGGQRRTGPVSRLLGQLDDDPLRVADVAEPVAVLRALQLADELRAMGSRAGDDGVDVFDGECDAADARCVRRNMQVSRAVLISVLLVPERLLGQGWLVRVGWPKHRRQSVLLAQDVEEFGALQKPREAKGEHRDRFAD